MRIRTMIVGSGKGKGKQNMLQQMGKQMGKHGSMNPHNMQMNVQQMSACCLPRSASYLFPVHAAALAMSSNTPSLADRNNCAPPVHRC